MIHDLKWPEIIGGERSLDHFIKILRSFHKGGEDKTFTYNFIDLLKERVMHNLQAMYEIGIKFENNTVIFPPPLGIHL
jgi:hypothetical protein